MDIAAFSGVTKKFNDGVWIDIKHPITQQPTGMRVLVASYLSEKAKAAKKAIADSEIREQKKNPRRVLTSDDLEKKSLQLVASTVLNWEGLTEHGDPLPCTYENIDKFIIKFCAKSSSGIF